MSNSASPHYIVVVEFKVHADCIEKFRAAIIENASASLTNEPDCLVFDVCEDQSKPDLIYLYEVYADRAAFDDHLDSAHFRDFNELTVPWVADKKVQTFNRVYGNINGEES